MDQSPSRKECAGQRLERSVRHLWRRRAMSDVRRMECASVAMLEGNEDSECHSARLSFRPFPAQQWRAAARFRNRLRPRIRDMWPHPFLSSTAMCSTDSALSCRRAGKATRLFQNSGAERSSVPGRLFTGRNSSFAIPNGPRRIRTWTSRSWFSRRQNGNRCRR